MVLLLELGVKIRFSCNRKRIFEIAAFTVICDTVLALFVRTFLAFATHVIAILLLIRSHAESAYARRHFLIYTGLKTK